MKQPEGWSPEEFERHMKRCEDGMRLDEEYRQNPKKWRPRETNEFKMPENLSGELIALINYCAYWDATKDRKYEMLRQASQDPAAALAWYREHAGERREWVPPVKAQTAAVAEEQDSLWG